MKKNNTSIEIQIEMSLRPLQSYNAKFRTKCLKYKTLPWLANLLSLLFLSDSEIKLSNSSIARDQNTKEMITILLF